MSGRVLRPRTLTTYPKTSVPLSYASLTAWPRASFTPTRTVTFTDAASLNTALSNMQAGDLIRNGAAAPFTISGEFTGFANKRPASKVVIDLTLPTTNQGVLFTYTGTSNTPAVWVHDSNSLTIYGGEMTTPNGGGHGVLIQGGDTTVPRTTHDITWWDFLCHDCGFDGFDMFPIDPSRAVNSEIYNMSIRGEVYAWAQHPAWDSHADKGTGMHACNCGDTTKTSMAKFHDSVVAIHGHDPSAVGGGACIEIGSDFNAVAGNLSNNVLYALSANFTFNSTTQTAGNCFNLWGSCPYVNLVIGWVEGHNMTGNTVHGALASPTAQTGGGQVVVNHGRHSVMLTNPLEYQHLYDDRWSIIYNDCT